MREAGYSPRITGAVYEGIQGQGVNPFNPIPLRQRTKTDYLGGKVRPRSQRVNFVPQNAQAQFAQAPEFAFLQPPPQQTLLDPVTNGATFLFQ